MPQYVKQILGRQHRDNLLGARPVGQSASGGKATVREIVRDGGEEKSVLTSNGSISFFFLSFFCYFNSSRKYKGHFFKSSKITEN